MEKEFGIGDKTINFAKDDFEKTLAPITLLISKSEKAQTKLIKVTFTNQDVISFSDYLKNKD